MNDAAITKQRVLCYNGQTYLDYSIQWVSVSRACVVACVQVASVMMNVISNLGDVNVSVTVHSNQENNTSERYGMTVTIINVNMYVYVCKVCAYMI